MKKATKDLLIAGAALFVGSKLLKKQEQTSVYKTDLSQDKITGLGGNVNKYVMKVWNGRSDKPTNADTTEFKTKKEAIKEAKTLRKIYGFSSTFPMHIVIYKKGSPDNKDFY